MARVVLAGFNLDADVIAALPPADGGAPRTPETLSAAYARISRDPRPVPELRREAAADVRRARERSERIVFGLGHKSVAEHAVFNFDLLDVSRLAIEAIESHRLASYTEKSQRYVRLGEDFVVPAEVEAAGLAEAFRAHVVRCFDRYRALCDGLVAAGVPDRIAGEDARYVLPLAVTGQLGMTTNARTLEHMVLDLAASPLAEVRDVSALLLAAASPIAPSLLRYCVPGPYQIDRARDVASAAAGVPPASAPGPGPAPESDGDAALIRSVPDGDTAVLAALVQPALGCGHAEAAARVAALDEPARARLYAAAVARLGPHDPLPRELEHAAMTFEVAVSAASFGQLKRHRMASPSPMPYDPGLDLTVPPTIAAAGLEPALREAAAEAGKLWERLGGRGAAAAPYALLNAHRRRVLLTINLRELHHVSRLREDVHAQWDIRALVGSMVRLARGAFPVCSAALGGKDAFGGE
ncbi:MAG: FAD-dependent thymidylate synthase [Deltaproteobacteria bacterium]|nr:FAD-dependent thymidylate synthase [Deltaproteobacteria bacterium]